MGENTLEEFKKRRDLWISCLNGDDCHSIRNQIGSMVWNAAAFRVVNEARRIAPPSGEGGPKLNAMVHGLINYGFIGRQMLAIRRLTDTSALASDNRKRDVFSLISLLDDMRSHAHLMTRANIFAAEGLEYDVNLVRDQFMEYAQQRKREGKKACLYPKKLNWHNLEKRHAEIDCFADVSEEQRSPGDAICSKVMDRLKDHWLARQVLQLSRRFGKTTPKRPMNGAIGG